MPSRPRVVIDTNCLVRRILLADTISARAVDRAVDMGILLVSQATMEELADVLARTKFDRYVTMEDRRQFLRFIGRVAEYVPIIYSVGECRDPKDDKFLEVAINGKADCILTRDRDLLTLNPWRGVEILPPNRYLNW